MSDEIDRKIRARLLSLSNALHPLADHASRWLGMDDRLGADEVCSIRRMPDIAPLAFMFRIYPGAQTEWFAADRNAFIPLWYRDMLRCMNGCFAYGFKLYGLPPSMQAQRPLMNRSVLQPLDLGTASMHWKYEFKSNDPATFHFGSRHFSYSENVGYFADQAGRIVGMRKNGEITGGWNEFAIFLKDELTAAAEFQAQQSLNKKDGR